jgi:hypothetical protein
MKDIDGGGRRKGKRDKRDRNGRKETKIACEQE